MTSKARRQATLATIAVLGAVLLIAIGVFLLAEEGDAGGGWTVIGAATGILMLVGLGAWVSRRR